jgi:hypothetical protein
MRNSQRRYSGQLAAIGSLVSDMALAYGILGIASSNSRSAGWEIMILKCCARVTTVIDCGILGLLGALLG